jgi:Aromatic acid exporter family member 1
VFRRDPAGRVGAAARAVAQRTPETMTVVRQRAQPTAVTIARLGSTAVFAYLLALQLPGSPRPVLAPLTALLVIQVSLSHTLRSAGRRVLSVVAGVLVAIGLSVVVGFTWWSLGILIAVALTVGLFLRLGDDILEVPISAMLILSAVGSRTAAADRVIETLIGAAAGLIGGLLFAPVRLQPAEEAIDDLSGQLAGLLDEIAEDIADGADAGRAADRLSQARGLSGEIQRVDRALSQSEDSLRLNPRARILPQAAIPLRTGLETLEHAAVTVRVIARWTADASRPGEDSPLRDPRIRNTLAELLRELAAAVRAIGDHVRAGIAAAVDPVNQERPRGYGPRLHRDRGDGAAPPEQVESELDQSLSRARVIQDRLTDMLRAGPETGVPEWSRRGELLMLLDRLRYELQEEHPARVRDRWPVRGSARRRRPRWVPPPPGPRPRPRERPGERAQDRRQERPRLSIRPHLRGRPRLRVPPVRPRPPKRSGQRPG